MRRNTNMKRLTLTLFFLISLQGFGAQTSHTSYSTFQTESAKFHTEIMAIDVKINGITNDLQAYRQLFDSISVPDTIPVTNRLSKNAFSVTERKLTPNNKKIKRLLGVLNNNELERIYCKYYPKGNFKRFKTEFHEEFQAIKDSYEEGMKSKSKRRQIVDEELAAETRKMKEKKAKTMAELNTDLRRVELSQNVRPGSINYNSTISTLEKLCNKYGVHTPDTLNSIVRQLKNNITLQIKSMENAEYLEGQRNLVSIVKKGAEADNDATYEELFTQMKIECLNRWYGQFETRFTSMLEAKQKELESEKLEVLAKAEALDRLLAGWNDISDKQIEAMNRKIRDKIVDDVMGSGFSEQVERESKEEEEFEKQVKRQMEVSRLKIESREREIESMERVRQDEREHEIELEKIRNNKTTTIKHKYW